MKCVCGYEKLGEGIQEDGQWRDADPEKDSFREIVVIANTDTYVDIWYCPVKVAFYACPESGTLKVEV